MVAEGIYRYPMVVADISIGTNNSCKLKPILVGEMIRNYI